MSMCAQVARHVGGDEEDGGKKLARAVYGAACAISSIAGPGSLEVLEGYEQYLGKPSLQVATGS